MKLFFVGLRRYEAAGWLRKESGTIGGKEFPAEPSEEEFRICLRSGIILCNLLNKIQPGLVPKVCVYIIQLFYALRIFDVGNNKMNNNE